MDRIVEPSVIGSLKIPLCEKRRKHNIRSLRCGHGFERWYRIREKGSTCVAEKRDPCSHFSKNRCSWWWTPVETIGFLVEEVFSLNPGICGRFEPSRQEWVAQICFQISQSRHHQVFRETSYPEGSYECCGTRTRQFQCLQVLSVEILSKYTQLITNHIIKGCVRQCVALSYT